MRRKTLLFTQKQEKEAVHQKTAEEKCISQQLCSVDIQLDHTFGFHSSPLLSTCHNDHLHLSSMPCWFYFQWPSNLTCHDFTNMHKPPPNFRSLLGLGLSFCPQPPFTANKTLDKTIA